MEKSFVATSFSTLAVLETLRELNLCLLPPNTYGGVKGSELHTPDGIQVYLPQIYFSLKKASIWIEKHDEPLVSNQMAGSILTLESVYQRQLVYDTKSIMPRLDCLLSRQTEEGWWSEYGGFDIGYSYVTLDYLARLWLLTKNERVKKSCDKLIDFLSNFVHPDGSVGRYYTSRGTAYIIPSGLEILSENPLARAIADVEIENLRRNPIKWDDRYLCYQLYYTLLAFRHYKPTEPTPLPYQQLIAKNFPIAGLNVISVPSDVKNGFSGSNPSEDYKVEAKDGRFYAYTSGKVFHSPEPYSPTPLMTPVKSVLLNLFQMTLGRNDVMAKWLKKVLRDNLIMKKKGTGSIYVPSARYYHKHDLED